MQPCRTFPPQEAALDLSGTRLSCVSCPVQFCGFKPIVISPGLERAALYLPAFLLSSDCSSFYSQENFSNITMPSIEPKGTIEHRGTWQ